MTTFLVFRGAVEREVFNVEAKDSVNSGKVVTGEGGQEISIGHANLLIASEVFPDLDVDLYEAKLRGLAQDVRNTIAKYGVDPKDPDQVIRAINTTLYLEKGLKYARLGSVDDVVLLNQDPKNLFLNGLLDRMVGTCISMPVLYIALGEELGYPIYGVNAGDHMFCRWDDGTYRSNIEPTGGGGWSPDEDYIRDMKVTGEQLKSGAYMRTLTKRELIGNFYFARASYYAATGQGEKAFEDFQRVVSYNPRDVDGYANLARLAAARAKSLGKPVDLGAGFNRVSLAQESLRRQREGASSPPRNGAVKMVPAGGQAVPGSGSNGPRIPNALKGKQP